MAEKYSLQNLVITTKYLKAIFEIVNLKINFWYGLIFKYFLRLTSTAKLKKNIVVGVKKSFVFAARLFEETYHVLPT